MASPSSFSSFENKNFAEFEDNINEYFDSINVI